MIVTLIREEFTECYTAEDTGYHWSDLVFQKLRDKGARYAIRPHSPGFIDRERDLSEYIGTQTKEELFNVPYVRRWAQREDFSHWREIRPGRQQNLLVAVFKNKEFYVVAHWTQFPDLESWRIGNTNGE